MCGLLITEGNGGETNEFGHLQDEYTCTIAAHRFDVAMWLGTKQYSVDKG